ncbi:hypothetical protein GCM10009839_66490 [Catenulispora yoronensis]|uniref:Uncharacterized protein n=1 Tax=Catenulispora yoronensis TaxID=450799 RepID=A0ABP5GSC2_9ACTN
MAVASAASNACLATDVADGVGVAANPAPVPVARAVSAMTVTALMRRWRFMGSTLGSTPQPSNQPTDVNDL